MDPSIRLAGKPGRSNWLVVEESTRTADGTFIHSCGSPLLAFSLQTAGGWTQVPMRNGYCIPAFTLEPDTFMDVPFCPNCESLSEGQTDSNEEDTTKEKPSKEKPSTPTYCPDCKHFGKSCNPLPSDYRPNYGCYKEATQNGLSKRTSSRCCFP